MGTRAPGWLRYMRASPRVSQCETPEPHLALHAQLYGWMLYLGRMFDDDVRAILKNIQKHGVVPQTSDLPNPPNGKRV